MKRRLFKLLILVSTALSGLTAALWLASQWWLPRVSFTWGGGQHYFGIAATPDGFDWRHLGLWIDDWGIVPYPPLIVLLLVPLAWSFLRKLERRIERVLRYTWLRQVRRRSGACHVCGYDLRATPRCCPECGTVPERRAVGDAGVATNSPLRLLSRGINLMTALAYGVVGLITFFVAARALSNGEYLFAVCIGAAVAFCGWRASYCLALFGRPDVF